MLALGIAAPQAQANPIDWLLSVTGLSADQGTGRAISDYTVQGVNPRGTTINLFDYDNGGSAGNINDRHVFHFASGGQSSYTEPLNSTTVNQWTGNYGYGNLKPAPRFGIVQDRLGTDGYPVLSNDVGGASLNYLFNDDSVSGKTSYTGVNGLLQVDEDGYYYYNSQQNFAQFNPDSNSFTLYNTWGVKPVGNSPSGQFFPFDTGSEVFDEQDGKLVQKDMNSGSGTINHFFGLTMSTRFVQRYGGHVDQEKAKPVTYNFSGDDDVWVYIDDVLVGDLGGIHDQVSLQIDFSTGDVVIYTDGRDGNNQGNNKFDADTAVDGAKLSDGQAVQDDIISGKDVYWKKITLKQLFQKAGVTSADSWTTNTLPDNTYHTLDFFYMERGASDSNMALKYNLVSIPETGIVKIDQDGTPMSNVEFTLRQANDSYNQVSGGMTVTGTTGANGELILTHASVGGADGTPYTLDELGDISRYWILTENNTPAGYRGVQPVHLYFAYGQTDNENLGTGPLLVANQWDTGAYSAPHVTVQADDIVYGTTAGYSYDLDDGGTMFAVVMKKVDGEWRAVSGDAYNGWSVAADNTNENILVAAKANPYVFVPGSNGSYETTIEDLPGDIKQYRYMLENNGSSAKDAQANAQYSVAYFYTTANDLSDATVTNTFRVDADGKLGGQAFDRIFSVTLNVPNVKNELSLVKTDATTGDPMKDVEFKLYNANDVTAGVPNEGAKPVSTMATGKDGTLQVYTDTDSQILAEGSYALVETTPEGYVDQNTTIPVVVDNSGVYADAGAADDNVTVENGLGTLVYSMKGFAAGDQVDATLHDVQAQPQKADAYSGANTVWTPDDDVLHLQYVDDNDSTLNYQGTNGSATTHTADAGWPDLAVTQCREHESADNALVKQDLKTTDLSALFTGDVTIHVTNKQPEPVKLPAASALAVVKNLEGKDLSGTDGDANNFDFTVTAVDTEGENQPKAADAAAKLGLTGDQTTVNFSNKAVTMQNGVATDTMNPMTNDLTFTEADAGKTFTYEVSEVKPDPVPQGYTYDETLSHTVTYAVELSADGTQVEVTASVDDEPVAQNATPTVTFNNSYHPLPSDATADFSGKKTVTNEHGEFTLEDGQFTFQVKNTQAPEGVTAPMPTGVDENDQVANDASGNFSFGKLTFTEPGTYAYTVSEVRPADSDDALDGITYSGETYTLTFKVEDKDGKLKVTKQTITNVADQTVNATDLNFENIYNDGQISYQIVGTKVFNANGFIGEQLDEGEFSFGLYEVGADGSETLVQTVQNGAPSGNTAAFQFKELTYTEPGTHTYKVYELDTDRQPGTGGTDGNNVTYSQEVYTVVVTVGKADGEAGQRGGLKVSAAITKDAGEQATAISFTNTYEAKPTSAIINGAKTYNDADGSPIALQGGEFTFVLSQNGQEVGRTTNKADGTFSFGSIEYTKAGTYEYSVSEQAGEPVDGDAFVSYDNTVYYVKVEVTENEETNSLEPVVTYYTDVDMNEDSANGAAFTNSQYKPHKDANPESGTTMHVGDTITYTIHYKNTENDPATVVVEDVLDKGLTYVEGTAKVNDSAAGDQFASNGQTLTWSIPDVPAGDKGTVSFQATVNESAVTKVDNQATVKVDNSSVTTNTTTHPVEGNLTISKKVSAPDGVTAPDTTFRFTVYVEGVTGQVNAKVQGADGVKDVTLNFSVDNTATVELKADESITIPLPLDADYTVTEEKSDRFESEGANPVTGTVGSDTQVSVNNKYTPDGQNEKSVLNDESDNINGQLVGVGDTLTYEIDWVNDTGKTATVTVTDAAPTGTEYVAGSASLNNDPEAQVDDSAAADGGNITWTIADVEPGAAGTVSFQVKVLESAVNNEDNTIKNAATVTIDNNPKQTNEVTNLVPEKSVDNTDMTRPGEELTYTISFTMDNEGTAKVEDLLTQGLVYKSDTASYKVNNGSTTQLEPTIDPQNHQQLTWNIPGLTQGDEVVLTFTVSVTNDVTGESVPNDATVNGHKSNVVTTPLDLETEPVPIPVTITKTLEGRDWVEGDVFSFTLAGKAQEGSPQDGFSIDKAEGTLTYEDAIAAQSDGKTEGDAIELSMGSITFSKAGTYNFTVTETSSALPSVTAQAETQTFTIVVTEENKGTLVPTPNTVTVDFVNTYEPTDAMTADLIGQKTVNGASKGIEAGAFTFEIEPVSAPDGVTAPMPSNVTTGGTASNAGGTVSNDADGVIHFGTFSFDAEGTYVYKVTEQNDRSLGYGYDETEYYVIFTVTENPAQGGFTVVDPEIHMGTQDGEKVSGIAFANTYKTTSATTEAPLAGKKTVKEEHGDFTLEAGQFTFQIRKLATDPADLDAPMPSLADQNGQVKNAADGSFSFGTFTFTEPGAYTYEVREVANSVSGVTYDGTVYTVSFAVEDQDGKLAVTEQTVTNGTEEVGLGDIDFENVYNDGQISYKISGTKVFNNNGFAGEQLNEGEFSFGLYEVAADGSETLIQTVKNGASAGNAASFQFDELTYTKSGTYTYKVYELGADGKPGTGGADDSNIIYSTEVYTVVVTVEQADGESGQHGGLKVSAATTNAEDEKTNDINFTNYYGENKKDVFEADDPTTSVNGKLVGVGDELVYTIDWAADEDGTVTVTDKVPDGTAITRDENGEVANVSDNGKYDEATNTITWELGKKSAGDKGTVSFHVTVTDDAVNHDPVTNTASIQVGENDPKQVTATTDIPAKTAADETPETGIQVGDVIDYTIQWANHEGGNQTITVVDTLPDGLTYVDGSATPADGFTADGKTLTWNLGERQPDAEGTVTFKAKVNEDALTVEDPIRNTATVTVGENHYQTNTTENEEPETGDLTISKTVVAGDDAVADEDTSFSFTVSLKAVDGSDLVAAYDAQVYNKDNDPVGPAFKVSGVDDAATADRVENTFTLKDGEHIVISGLPEGATYTVTEAPAGEDYTQTEPANGEPIQGTIPTGDENASGSFTNTYYNPGDAKDVQNEAGDSIDGQTVSVGDVLTYTIDWINSAVDEQGNPAAATVTITDTVPTGTELVEDSISDGGSQAEDGTITWTLEDQQPGATGTVSFKVRVSEDAAGTTVENQATVTIGDHSPQTNVVTNPVYKPEKTVDPASGTGVYVGDTLTYTVSYKNTESDPATVTITDPLDKGLDFVSADNNGVYDQDTHTITWTIPDVAAGAEGTVSFKATVNASAEQKVENTATVQVGNNPAVDTNTVENPLDTPTNPGAGTVSATKTLTGRDWFDGDRFTFALAPADDATAAAVANGDVVLPGSVTLTKAEAQAAAGSESTEGVKVPVTFGDIAFNKAGTYTFTLTEDASSSPNVVNASGSATFTFEVTAPAGQKNLNVAAPTVTGTTDFVNEYNPDAATAGLTATKTVNGASKGIEAGAFSFKIEAEGNAPLPSGVAADGIVANEPDGVVSFGTFTFTEPGTYTYTVAEVKGDKPGYTYDETAHQVVFTVTDDPATGKLVAAKTVDGVADGTLTFSNTYQPTEVTTDVDAPFSGVKTLVNEHGTFELQAGQFSFTMTSTGTDPAGLEAPEPSNGSTVTNEVDGSFNFGTLTFKQPGTYTYQVSETVNNVAGITYDGTVYALSFTVEDQNGQLVITNQSVTKGEESVGADGLNFSNTYNDGEVSYQIGGTKVLETNGFTGESLAKDAYTFVLVDENGQEIGRTTNGEPAGNSASFAFEPITYTEPGTHTYKVYELGADGQAGTGGVDDNNVTHSTEVYTVTVTVSSDEDAVSDAALKVTADVQNADIVFTNSYTPTPGYVGPEGSAQISGTKQLTGRALNAGEFTFELLSGNDVVDTATNAADGTFTFGKTLEFTQPGTYTYAVREVAGNLGGVTYDDALYTVVVTVTEDAEANALVPQVSYQLAGQPVEGMGFSNIYEAAPEIVTLGAAKQLDGAELADGQFTFELAGADGAPMPEETTATNAANGTVSFGPITYNEPGEYDYTVTEVNDGQDGVTYDADSTRTVHVSVVDNGQGNLVATVTYGDDGAVFVNTAQPEVPTPEQPTPDEPTPEQPTPEQPTPGEPQNPEQPGTSAPQPEGSKGGKPSESLPVTGDDLPMIAGGTVVAALALVACGVILRKRSQR